MFSLSAKRPRGDDIEDYLQHDSKVREARQMAPTDKQSGLEFVRSSTEGSGHC